MRGQVANLDGWQSSEYRDLREVAATSPASRSAPSQAVPSFPRGNRVAGAPPRYVTHDQTEAMTMATGVQSCENGVLQQLAPPQELYDPPNNLFVASFMGSPSMNLYEGSRLAFSVDTKRIHFFDSQTGASFDRARA
jgi:hypothetical protein